LQNAKRTRATQISVNLNYSEFVSFLLEFQLKGYEKYLEPFLNEFRRADGNKDGIISFDEFRDMIDSLRLGDAAERLYEALDEQAESSLTLSDCVLLLNN
jgi:Ca2+-binding EF-hand superfamily protein